MMLSISKRIAFTAIGLGILFLVMLASFLFSGADRARTVVVGGKNDTESMVVSEIFAQLIEGRMDVKVRRRFQLDGTLICFEALLAGDVDIYCEYTGTASIFILNEPYRGEGRNEVYSRVKEAFRRRFDIEWLKPLGFNNQYVLITSNRCAEENGLQTIADFKALQQAKKEVTLAYDSEFSCLPECELLKTTYGIELASVPLMEKTLAYISLLEGGIDAMVAYQTDALVTRQDVCVLKDNKGAFPPYDAAPIVRREALERWPELQGVLEALAGRLSERVIRELNEAVERGGRCQDVARDFLTRENLIGN